jgi:predicted nucleotidyltransferase
MDRNNKIILMIKDSIATSEPSATVILYGSFARGDNRKDSDVDLLILLEGNKVTREDEIKVKYPLYEIEFETGQIISPLVLSRTDWETKHNITPFYENVNKEGIVL